MFPHCSRQMKTVWMIDTRQLFPETTAMWEKPDRKQTKTDGGQAPLCIEILWNIFTFQCFGLFNWSEGI